MSMTQEQINVGLFDEVKKLQQENVRLREALEYILDHGMSMTKEVSVRLAEQALSNAKGDSR